MRIAMITDTYWPRVNGVAMSVDSFRRELTRFGHEVVVLCPEYPHHVDDAEAGVARFPSFNPLVSKEDRLVRTWEQLRVFSFLDRFQPDVIHVQTEMALGNMGRRWGIRRHKPVVMTSHTYFEKYVKFYVPWFPARLTETITRRLTSHILNAADLVVVPTGAMKKVLEDYGIQKPLRVIPTGINPEDFSGIDRAWEQKNSAFFQRFPQLRHKPVLLYVGRLGREKNVDFLLDVVQKLRLDGHDFHFLVIGDGPYRGVLEATAAEKGLSETVVFAGYVDRGEIRHAYSLADVFVFASKTETQGMVTIESMLCGTPVVAIGEMGTKEVMAGDNGGYMVDENLEVFAARVADLLTSTRLRREKSLEAQAYAQNWLIETMARRLEQTYREAIAIKMDCATPV